MPNNCKYISYASIIYLLKQFSLFVVLRSQLCFVIALYKLTANYLYGLLQRMNVSVCVGSGRG